MSRRPTPQGPLYADPALQDDVLSALPSPQGGVIDVPGHHARVNGTAGQDEVTLGASGSQNLVMLHAGDDMAWIQGDLQTVQGGQGADTMHIMGTRALVSGGEGADVFLVDATAGAQGNTLVGGQGDDTFLVTMGPTSAQQHYVRGGAGQDSLHVDYAARARVTVELQNNAGEHAGRFNDIAYKGIETLSLSLTAGNDRLELNGFHHDVTVDAGAGADWIHLTQAPMDGTDLVLSSAAGWHSTSALGIDFQYAGFETFELVTSKQLTGVTVDASQAGRLMFSSAHLDHSTLLGGDGDDILGVDTFQAAGWGNLLDGGAGDDSLVIRRGDTARGGAGDDLLVLDNSDVSAPTPTLLDGGDGRDGLDLSGLGGTLVLSDDPDDLIGAPDLELTGLEYWASLTGSDASDLIDARAVSTGMHLSGGGGNDTVLGGAGADTISAWHGRDVLGLDGGDWVMGAIDHVRKISLQGAGIGDGDLVIDGATEAAGPGGFDSQAELVLITTAGSFKVGELKTQTATSAAAMIGQASSDYAEGQTAVFGTNNGDSTVLWLFTSDGHDATVSASELTLIATLTGSKDFVTTVDDYLWGS
ncbi:hypothetical protein [Ideonella livida]|uniref:Calcium-binding protein n=1 Tax=Ideonella livida TaxID=2707176 RepID=A0A7C9PF71_9BURK|nr:hypothetical protein [Ideonella livida]NDY90396.1 hypothetical protein [Ideonella livida]